MLLGARQSANNHNLYGSDNKIGISEGFGTALSPARDVLARGPRPEARIGCTIFAGEFRSQCRK